MHPFVDSSSSRRSGLTVTAALVAAVIVSLSVPMSAGCNNTAVSGTDIKDTVRRTYFEAVDELVGGNYVRARQLLNQVARAPRYFRYAALARLRIGDSLYLQERYEEAIQLYRAFTAQYKSDPNLPYARYRMAVCYYKRMPSEWFASVADHELDQTMTTEAVRELTSFIRTFPVSRFTADARLKLKEARQMLLDHVLYAADFYDSRDKPRAVAWRLDDALKRYPDFVTTDAIVWRMADSYAKAGDQADAARSYAMYLEKFDNGEQRAEAKRRLDVIRRQLVPSLRKKPAGPAVDPKIPKKGDEKPGTKR